MIKDDFLEMYGYMFDDNEIDFIKGAEFKRVGNDLCVYDPQGILGVTCGDMGDGWRCLIENYFKKGEKDDKD